MSLSFRTKLLLVMMLVVVGVSGLTLYVSQQRVQAAYQRLFQERFDVQVNSFTDLQRARLSFVADTCQHLVDSVRFYAALEAGDADVIYDTAADELREVLAGNSPRPQATFFRFLDPRGQVIPTTNPRAGLVQPQSREVLARQLATVQNVMAQNRDQQIGFLATATDDGVVQLHELIVTKVIDKQANNPIRGALILAFPVPELAEPLPAAPAQSPAPPTLLSGRSDLADEIGFGIWVHGVLFSRADAIPAPVRPILSQQLAEEIRQGQPLSRDLTIDVDEVPHRVFSRALNTGASFPPAYQVCLYSLAGALAEQRTLTRRILLFGGITLAAAFAISFGLSHGLSVPIRELVAGTNQIRQGNFDVTVRVRGRDDLGRLATSFNEMAVGLAQKERYRTVLNMVADEQVAQQLVTGQLRLGGERREATILFCDIRGFTSLTENMPPEEVIEMLNEHMTCLAGVVKEFHGVVDKFVGDLIMALFGAPLTRGNDALLAASCAVHMIQRRQALNRSSQFQIRVGIGLATGQIVAGCMGSHDRLNYTVLGTRVNLASRLCSQADPDTIVIDSATRDLLGESATVLPLPPLTLKGFREPVAAYQLLSVSGITIAA